ncbi:DUF3011 domain-containing protein [Sandaracinobacteroides saxicola]|uniref:DUF3011 domain-containing protein n=1 Tax=Sandaracinobacteroides saxicola TaxID=2759707 RepID=A0A7G5IDR4_9SPHN|nr:DUF3011 domain-containing protein [Sandaracinobacteroides saxicola]QMW21506.1 DUF3011 domain-containing protein [Sandaracinobacteroides saxicola]
MRNAIIMAASVAILLNPVSVAAQYARPETRPAPRPEPEPVRPLRDRAAPGGSSAPAGGVWAGATIRCESRNNGRRECSADTRGGVRLVRQLSDAACREHRTWGTTGNAIWVDNGCRGEFQTRYGGGGHGGHVVVENSSSGPSTAAIIGGVAVAGGLIALLAKPSKGSKPAPAPPPAQPGQPQPVAPPPAPALPAAPAGPAKISASLGGVTPDARPALGMCLNDAARQIGATGGSEIKLDRLDDVAPGNGGFRFRMMLVGIYPDKPRVIPTFCRATPTKVVELTFG